MTELSLADLSGHVVADRYRLDAQRAVGLLSAVFQATDLAPDAEPEPIVLQLRRPWGDAEAAPLVELHDHQLLGGGFTADIVLQVDLEAAAGAAGDAAAVWLVTQTDAALPEADPDATSPGLPAPFADTHFEAAWLSAADHDALAAAIDEAVDADASLLDDLGEVLPDDLPDELPDGTLAGGEFDAGEVTDAGAPRSGVSDTALEMPLLTFDRSREG
jgi:hypothetical protein